MTTGAPRAGSDRWAPIAVVAVMVGLQLVVLRGELLPAATRSDRTMHESMVRWALGRIEDGHTPFDGWYPYLSLGSPWFHRYQSLPHVLTALAAVPLGVSGAFLGSMWLLLGLWPASVYAGARLLGLGRWESAAAAVAAPLVVSEPVYGFEYRSYLWRGSGIWSGLWGMVLLPPALGAAWRSVTGRLPLVVGALAVGITIACHFLTGYLALLALAAWVLASPSRWRRRLPRAAVVGVGALASVAWVIVPVLAERRWAARSLTHRHTLGSDSYGLPRFLGYLVRGEVFDDGRLPVLTVFALVGLVVAVRGWRRDERLRALLLFGGLSLVLVSGRPTFGWLLRFLPGNADLYLHRFVMGIHLAGVLLAGIGIAAAAIGVRCLLGRVRRLPDRGALVGAVAVLLVALSPAALERLAYARRGASMIEEQRGADRGEGANIARLVAAAKRLGGGRMYGNALRRDGERDGVGFVPTYSLLPTHDADSLGLTERTLSLSTDAEIQFDPGNRAHYETFGVRWLVLPRSDRPEVAATLIATAGEHALWETPSSGYLGVVDTASFVVADRATIGDASAGFLASSLGGRVHPTVAYDGSPAGPPTLRSDSVPPDPPGVVVSEVALIDQGRFEGRVALDRPGYVILKATFDPGWVADVGGRRARTWMVAPSLVGVVVPAGSHHVAFHYRLYPHLAGLLALSAGAVSALALAPALAGRLRRRRRDADELIGLGLALAVAAAGSIGLGGAGLWRDEGFTARLVTLPLDRVVRFVVGVEPNGALYDAFLAVWARLGRGEAFLRLPSVLAVAVAVAATHLLGRRLVGRTGALAGAVAVAGNGLVIQLAQEARSYAFELALATVAGLLLARAVLDRDDRAWRWYPVLAAAAVWCHYLAVLAVGGHVLAAALVGGRECWRRLARAAACTAALVAPLGLFVVSDRPDSLTWIPRTSVGGVRHVGHQVVGGGRLWPVLAVALVAAAVLAARRGAGEAGLRFALVAAGVPLFGGVALSLARPLLVPRYFVVAIPFLALAAAGAAARLPRPRAGMVAAAALAAIVLVAGVAGLGDAKPDSRAAARYVVEGSLEGDAIAFPAFWGVPVFQWYGPRYGSAATSMRLVLPQGPHDGLAGSSLWRDDTLVRSTPSPLDVDRLRGDVGGRRVWVVVDGGGDDRTRAELPQLLDALAGHARCSTRSFGGVVVALFAPGTVRCP